MTASARGLFRATGKTSKPVPARMLDGSLAIVSQLEREKGSQVYNSLSEHRAKSESSGRTRSQMRCDACEYWSAGHRCNRATSIAYSRKTSGEAHCQQWEPKK